MSNFIQRMIKPHKRRVWMEFCQQTGSEFLRERGKGLKKFDVIKAQYKNWVIKIDTPARGRRATITRVRAAYLNTDSFYFRIYREGLFQGLQKKLGLQDLVVGHPNFDDAFIIQGNDQKKLKQLFADEEIRKIISWQPDIHLKNIVDDSWSAHEEQKGVSMLEFKIMGVIADLDRLLDLYQLFSLLLERLSDMGSAHKDGLQFS